MDMNNVWFIIVKTYERGTGQLYTMATNGKFYTSEGSALKAMLAEVTNYANGSQWDAKDCPRVVFYDEVNVEVWPSEEIDQFFYKEFEVKGLANGEKPKKTEEKTEE